MGNFTSTPAPTPAASHTLPTPLPADCAASARLPDVHEIDSPDLVATLIRLGLLLPLDRPCHTCATPLSPRLDAAYADGWCLRCWKCRTNFGVRHGSFFADFALPLRRLCRLLRSMEAHNNLKVAVAGVAREHQLGRTTMTKVWKRVRERMQAYVEAHPVQFDEDDVVEVDECYLKPLQKKRDKEAADVKQPPPTWIIGAVSRNTGKVSLQFAPTHSAADVEAAVRPSLPHKSTTVLSDCHKSFKKVFKGSPYFQSKKKKYGHAKLNMMTYTVETDKGELKVHSNTIEGYWAHFRLAVRNHTKISIFPVMYESMYRRLHISIAAALQVAPVSPDSAAAKSVSAASTLASIAQS